MKLKEPLRYLKQAKTGAIYIRTEALAARPDMTEYVPEQPKAEPKEEPKAEPASFEIKKANKKADLNAGE